MYTRRSEGVGNTRTYTSKRERPVEWPKKDSTHFPKGPRYHRGCLGGHSVVVIIPN